MKAVLDAGALVAVDRRDRMVGAQLRVLQRQGTPLRASAAVIGQVWRDSGIGFPMGQMLGHSYWEKNQSMDWDILVVREGDRVTASGRLVRNESGDWLEPPLFMTGLPQGIRPVSDCAVRVTGADFDALSHRREDHGAVEGYATMTGIWSADQLQAERQTPPGNGHRPSPRWVIPPCAAPVGGWPRLTGGHDDKNLHYDPGDLMDSGAAVAMTTFRPSEDQAVLVIAATDRDAVEARLRPQLGERLCVVASRWTKAELDAARAHLDAHYEQWNLLQLGPSHGEDGQPCMAAKLTRVLPDIATWAASLPTGILSLDPWLRHADLAAS